MKQWTDEEIEFIYENYGLMSSERLAKELGRTVSSVRSFIFARGIKKKEVKKRTEFIRANGETLCWNCRWATNPPNNPCDWSKKLKPLDTWNAEKIKIEAVSYIVKECPLYEKDTNWRCEEEFIKYLYFINQIKESVL